MVKPDAAVEADGLVVRRAGHVVLDGLTFTVPRAQVTGLLGPSGCGKTTLMRTLVGVQMIDAGQVELLGLSSRGREVAVRGSGTPLRTPPSTAT